MGKKCEFTILMMIHHYFFNNEAFSFLKLMTQTKLTVFY